MTTVIRIDDEVMNELKKKAVEYSMVFETPNAILRKIFSLDSKSNIQPAAIAPSSLSNRQNAIRQEYIVYGEIYKQYPKEPNSTWEIGHLKKPSRDLIPYDQYPFVKEVGISITLVIEGKEYPVSYHHYEGKGGGYIGRSSRDTPSIKEILANHSLDKHKMPVTLHFRANKVWLESTKLVVEG